MEMHAANYPRGSDDVVAALLLVTLIVLALFVLCFLVFKAIEWLRNRRKCDGVAAEGEQKPYAPEGFGREGFGAAVRRSHLTDMAGFSEREEEEFLLLHGPKQVRKAIKERRKAREQPQKKPGQS
jgi:hypothetical protein